MAQVFTPNETVFVNQLYQLFRTRYEEAQNEAINTQAAVCRLTHKPTALLKHEAETTWSEPDGIDYKTWCDLQSWLDESAHAEQELARYAHANQTHRLLLDFQQRFHANRAPAGVVCLSAQAIALRATSNLCNELFHDCIPTPCYYEEPKA